LSDGAIVEIPELGQTTDGLLDLSWRGAFILEKVLYLSCRAVPTSKIPDGHV